MKNLFAYNIGTQSVNELDKYKVSDLSGNDAYVASTSSSIFNYSNISSLSSWDKYGQNSGLRHCDVRKEIKEYWETNLGSTWSGLTQSDKEVIAKYFLVDKNKRDEVLTQQEQDDYDHFVIYHYLNDDAIENLGSFNLKTTPKSIDYKKDVNMRFYPKYTFDNAGFLTECEYFENLNITYDSFSFSVFNYSNPVLKYEADYIVGDDDYVKSRTVTRSWYLMSGTYSDDTKVSTKVYQPLTSRDEGRRRRKNLINRLIIDTVGLFIMTSGDLDTVMEAEEDAIVFMKEVSTGITDYYEYGSKHDSQGNPCHLYQQVLGSTYSRLDNWVPGTGDTVSIRMFILSRLEPDLSGYKI